MCFWLSSRQCTMHIVYSERRPGSNTVFALGGLTCHVFPGADSEKNADGGRQGAGGCHPNIPRGSNRWHSIPPLIRRDRRLLKKQHNSCSPNASSQRPTPEAEISFRWCILKLLSRKPHASKFPRHLKKPTQSEQQTLESSRKHSCSDIPYSLHRRVQSHSHTPGEREREVRRETPSKINKQNLP